jgi:hypothetical protein
MTAEEIMASVEAAAQRRAEAMPTEHDAIRAMHDAWVRLKDLGWRDGQYMPTTGERHAGIQCGSTGIHAMTATRDEGPFGALTARTTWTTYDGDIWPSSAPPVLFRPWKETDVQPNLRPCYPMPEEAPPKSMLRKPLKRGERLVCYCPPGVCQAPKGFSGPCNRADEAGVPASDGVQEVPRG